MLNYYFTYKSYSAEVVSLLYCKLKFKIIIPLVKFLFI